MLIKQDNARQFADLPFVEFVFNEDHPLLELAQQIKWDEFLGHLGGYYSQNHGRPCTPLRAQAGTLMLKFLKNLSDRDAVAYVQENIYAQRFCGLAPAQASDYMDPATGLTNFRIKITPEGMALIQETLNAAAQGKSNKKGNKLIVDTTCVPSDILYPTDIRLLERCRQGILRLFKEAKKLGLEVLYRNYSRTARKVFVSFCKKSKPNKETRRRVHKRMFQFVRRNLSQLMDLRQKATGKLGPKCRANPETRGFLQELKSVEQRIRAIIHQQQFVRQGKLHIPNRIVSFHKDHVRPMVRGKFPLGTEFGPKALFAVVKGCVYLIDAFQNNVSDATLVVPALRWFKTKFGRLPKEILGDRGFFARWRSLALKGMGITPGLQQRGKAVEKSPAQRRMIRQRLPIEAFISLGKRKFGWAKCRARIPQHEASWIGLGAAAMNAHRMYYCNSP